jgi:DNA polymerase-3 subunit alpha
MNHERIGMLSDIEITFNIEYKKEVLGYIENKHYRQELSGFASAGTFRYSGMQFLYNVELMSYFTCSNLLAVMQNAHKMIEDRYGVRVDFTKIKYGDSKVFELMGSGDTAGMFVTQSDEEIEVFETKNDVISSIIYRLSPTSLDDIIAGISLYSCGQREFLNDYIENKKHPDKIKYLYEKLAPILSGTYGIMIYQEQLMKILHELAGYSYCHSDTVRRALAKRESDIIVKERDCFVNGLAENGVKKVSGCVGIGIPASVANEIFDEMISFSPYIMNKSHAVPTAVFAYRCAWTKTYYLDEFMTAYREVFG